MPDLLAHLNEPQYAAVTLPAQHALILAGAGSGKTRVLTTRMAWLMQTGQASPDSILAVTFTNKAAREMLTRLGSVLPFHPRGMWIGTFHGLCNRLLRAHYQDAALPQSFQILDSSDQLAAIKRLLKGLGLDDERFAPRTVQQFINGCKEAGMRAHAVPVTDANSRQLIELYAAYDAQCQREGVVDFPELLVRCFELLERHVVLRAHYQARFRYLLIDEFQDTNVLQYRWIKLLTGPQSAVMAVGDDDQSIYAFRGANVGNMAAFEREFKVQNLIKLEQNYRSHGHILDCANQLIRQNAGRLGKELWTEAGVGEPVRVHEALSDAQEAQWLVEEVRALIATGSVRSEIALLYRSNAQSRVLEHALFSAGMPYRVYGGLRFFERAEIKHALAYLRLMENPDDDTALLRVVNFPARGIGARSLEQLQDSARQGQMSLYRAVSAMPAGAMAAKLAGFVQLIERCRADTWQMPLPDVVAHVLERSGLMAFYQTEREGQERIENLRELINAAAAYVAEQGLDTTAPAAVGTGIVVDPVVGVPLAPSVVTMSEPTAPQSTPLAAFLAHASLESGDHQADAGTDALQLMTVHASKGLEFSVVFITGLEEGLFPHDNAVHDPAGLEEERRLMYVAVTRARERLYLSFAQTRMLHGQTRYNVRSRFINELPDGALKWLTPRAGLQRAAWGGGMHGQAQGRGASYEGSAWPARMAQSAAPSAADQHLAGRFERGLPWRMGQAVAHAKFGEGVILGIEGGGTDARVQVNFGAQGVKWLALSVAKLTAIGV